MGHLEKVPIVHNRHFSTTNGKVAPPLVNPVSGRVWLLKRVMDVTIVLCSGILALPLMAFIALWIKLDSEGPIFFRQQRPGLHRKRFHIYKFRTMHVGAADQFSGLDEHLQEEFACYGKIKDDPRVTRAGRVLRRLSLDELPQLWNILRGEMSLVGPRAYMMEQLSNLDGHDLIFQVKPGLTGLWQVSGRNTLTFKRRLELDEDYVRRVSIWHDLTILGRTVRVVLTGHGAY
jgi:lipopolysaccharide/colanic/teichoic acid biosynthesis glycosyltransferase